MYVNRPLDRCLINAIKYVLCKTVFIKIHFQSQSYYHRIGIITSSCMVLEAIRTIVLELTIKIKPQYSFTE